MPSGVAIDDAAYGPVIGPEQDFSSVTERVSDLVLRQRTPLWWYIGAAVSLAFFVLFIIACTWTFAAGVGIWGVNIPVAWGLALANYVWWIGIASGGTFISSLFYLLGADWKLCCRILKIDKGDFFHKVYRIEEILGQTFLELKPYPLFPLYEYFGPSSEALFADGFSIPRRSIKRKLKTTELQKIA